MTALSYIAGFLMALTAAAAVRRIARMKDRSPGTWVTAAFLVWPVGLALAAFAQPMDPQKDRLSWWSESAPARAWTGLTFVIAALFVGTVVYSLHQPATVNGVRLEGQIKHWLAKNGAPGATVSCPNYQVKAGYVFLCAATASTGTAHVRVTVDNSQGDVEWQLIG